MEHLTAEKAIEAKILYWTEELKEAEETRIIDHIAFCRGMVSGLKSAIITLKIKKFLANIK